MTEFAEASEAGDLKREDVFPSDKTLQAIRSQKRKCDHYSRIVRDTTKVFVATREGGSRVGSIENPSLAGSLGSIIIHCKNNPYYMIQRGDACFAVGRGN